MNVIADLHIHSRFAQACSNKINVKELEKWARIKGIDVLGTGDFTHPKWMAELKEELEEDGTGILKTESGFPFMLQVEVSQIYTDKGRGRRIHNLIYAPSFEIADQVTDYFKSHGRVDYDGRPIFKISNPELVESLRSISKDIEIIPAHVWTPWFSLFGSRSGWDSIKEAFDDQAKHIHALETGLSSDPSMNWRISNNDRFNLVSFSDSHSFWPWRLGREATIFDIKKLSYDEIIGAIRTGDGLKETIEVDPNYGKYHVDGHRKCDVTMEPEEAEKHGNKCPKCGKELTLGVLHRVNDLADREHSGNTNQKFRHLLPLSEILSNMLDCGLSTKTVWKPYWALIEEFGSEYEVLLRTPVDELKQVVTEEIAEAIIRNRNGKIKVNPGYDGVYGKPELSSVDKALKSEADQKGLGEFV